MISIISMYLTIVIVIAILIIAVYTIQPSIQPFALQGIITNNHIIKNSTNITDNTTANVNDTVQIRRSDDIDSKLNPSDMAPFLLGGITNSQQIINLLSSMTSDDISKFPLKDIPADELVIVLEGLSVPNLFKTLDNIPADNLADIFNKIPQDKSQKILNKLPSDQSEEILNRLTSALYK
jgi:hypothetical protein